MLYPVMILLLVAEKSLSLPPELLITTFVTPIVSAVAVLFWLLNNEKNKRIEDRDKVIETQNTRIGTLEDTVGKYRDSIIPALQSSQKSMADLADLYAKRQGREDIEHFGIRDN